MSKARAHCPHCASRFTLPREYGGRRAKCVRCHQRFVVQFDDGSAANGSHVHSIPQNDPDIRAQAAAVISSPFQAAVRESAADQMPRRLPRWSLGLLGSAGALVVGFVAGSEYSKYRFRNGTTQARHSVAKRFVPDVETPALPHAEPSSAAMSDGSTRGILARRMIGESFDADGFTLVLLEARVTTSQDAQTLAAVGIETAAGFIAELQIENTDDQQTLHLHADDMFGPSHFRLRDNADNPIGKVGVDNGLDVSEALGGAREIGPGATAAHFELFDVPPAGVEYLILTVDLECFGGDGEIEFQIPGDQIKRSGS
jgi:hypothetical protein